MKIKILLILLLTSQVSFAQNEFFDKIKYANVNIINGLHKSDKSFIELVKYLEPINDTILIKANDSLKLDSNSEIIYYINRITIESYTTKSPKYTGFITNLKANEIWGFKYMKYTWKSDYELTIYKMTPNDYNYQYYSFLIKSSDGNAEEIFAEIDKYRTYFSNISFEGVSDYEFLYVLDGKKESYKGYSFILSHLIFLQEEAEKLDKFDQ